MFRDEFANADRAAGEWQRYVVPQDWGHFTAEEHAVWDVLFARQVPYLGTRIVAPFLAGIPMLALDRPGIPELGALNARLTPLSGWELVSVANGVSVVDPGDKPFLRVEKYLFTAKRPLGGVR